MSTADDKGGQKKKRPYAPPRVSTSRLYERNALACGKTPKMANSRRECRHKPNVS